MFEVIIIFILTNLEWPKSSMARGNMLDSRRKLELSYHLVMMKDDLVIAHAAASDTSFEQRLFGPKCPHVERVFTISSVVVDPSMRGQGIGQVLMKELESRVLKDHEGISEQIQLNSIKFILKAETARAAAFYKKLGYEEYTNNTVNCLKQKVAKDIDKSNSNVIESNTSLPPPPPIPDLISGITSSSSSAERKIPMFKRTYMSQATCCSCL